MEQEHDPRICMALTPDGLTAYCNRSGLLAMSKRLAEIAQSLPDEHYEMHVRLELEDGAAPQETNVAVLRTKELAPLVAPHGRSDQQDFELTFMHVPEHELDDLRAYQVDGLLPDSWNSVPQEE
jgi:hypothetical protein